MARCPKCESPVSYVSIQPVSAKSSQASWYGITYSCPSCDSVLSVSIDPIALKNDIVSEIVGDLRRD